jgi:hypothetical protein
MIVDQLQRVLAFLTIGATLLTLVGFVSLFCFSIYGGWVRRKANISPFDAIQGQSE